MDGYVWGKWRNLCPYLSSTTVPTTRKDHNLRASAGRPAEKGEHCCAVIPPLVCLYRVISFDAKRNMVDWP